MYFHAFLAFVLLASSSVITQETNFTIDINDILPIPDPVPRAAKFRVSVNSAVSSVLVTRDEQSLYAAVGNTISEYTLNGTFVKSHVTAPSLIQTMVLTLNDTSLLVVANGTLFQLKPKAASPSLDPISLSVIGSDPIMTMMKPSSVYNHNILASDTDETVYLTTSSGIFEYRPDTADLKLLVSHANITATFGKGLLVTNDHVYRSFSGGVAKWSRTNGLLNMTYHTTISPNASNFLLLQDDILFSSTQGFWYASNASFIRVISGIFSVTAGIVSKETVFVAASGFNETRQYRTIRGIWKMTNYLEEYGCVASQNYDLYGDCLGASTIALGPTSNTFVVGGEDGICIYPRVPDSDWFFFCGMKDRSNGISIPAILGIAAGSIFVIIIGVWIIYAREKKRKQEIERIQKVAGDVEAGRKVARKSTAKKSAKHDKDAAQPSSVKAPQDEDERVSESEDDSDTESKGASVNVSTDMLAP